jgi:hypothetical protein
MSGILSLVLAAALSSPQPLALEVDQQRDTLRVSFQLLEPLPVSIEQGLPSGAEVTVRYPLRVRSPRALWWDRKHWKGEVVATAIFDPITGRYRCEAVLDGVIVSSHEMDSAEDAREFLAAPGPVLLSLSIQKRARLLVRVRAVFSSSTKWLVFPSVDGTPWVEVAITPRGEQESHETEAAGDAD